METSLRPIENDGRDTALAQIRPHLDSLYAQIAAAHRAYLTPEFIEVPSHFTAHLDGGLLFGLPVRRTNVPNPCVMTRAIGCSKWALHG
jgi:hypothetical protein